jgi:molybdopterin biosynthesis enzyme
MADDPVAITQQILVMKEQGCSFIILTGGMSVDPDDVTKVAIRDAGVEVVSYGAPLLPGNMFMLGYLGSVPVIGLPACAMFFKITVLDVFLPYIFSNTKISLNDIQTRGYGGFCRYCQTCNFPYCGFGKK